MVDIYYTIAFKMKKDTAKRKKIHLYQLYYDGQRYLILVAIIFSQKHFIVPMYYNK